jgi:hypothetical protein
MVVRSEYGKERILGKGKMGKITPAVIQVMSLTVSHNQ